VEETRVYFMTTSNCFINFTFCLTVLFVEETIEYTFDN